VNLLALDTSTDYCSAALWLDGDLRARGEAAGQRHTELILPMVDELLAQAGLALTQLDGIAFGAGPGSFTGLRIACGVAQGLAFGADVPLMPVSTLLALAEGCDAPRVIAALDARMHEVYLAAYTREGGDWREVRAPCLHAPAQALRIEGSGWTALGAGFAAYPALAEGLGERLVAVDAQAVPTAAAVARLAARGQGLSGWVDCADAAPVYLRDKVAFTIAERAAGMTT
jgi:tRNA threonylcarbamoyladenosine biosynthesis protein TsaB